MEKTSQYGIFCILLLHLHQDIHTTGFHVEDTSLGTPDSGCPSTSWTAFGEKCYILHGSTNEKVSWLRAHERCREKGATLISIHSQEEQDFLTQMIMDRHFPQDTWIGLKESSRSDRYFRGDREFVWTDGSALVFTDWREGEPSSREEKCVHLWFRQDETNGKWNDVPCRLSMWYICQVPREDSTRPKFLSNAAEVTVPTGHSVTFHCDTENTDEFAISWKNIENDLVFSGPEKNTEDERFQLVNHTSLHISAVQPTDSGAYSCVISTEPELKLNHFLRVTSRPSPRHRCPNKSEKWIDLGGDFCYIVETNDQVSWSDAIYNCYKEGGSLASFHSSEETNRIVKYLKHEEGRLYIGLWKNNDGSLQWVDQSMLDYKNWDFSEPSDREEQCVEIYTESGKWNDIPCSHSLGYICSSLKSDSKTTQNKPCPDTSTKWKDFGGDNCYIIETEELKWDEASERCSEEGGTLASFHSVEEVTIIQHNARNLAGRLFIGLRQNKDGQFEWLDRTPYNFNYWVYSEPDDSGNVCVEMNTGNGLWFDLTCEHEVGYVCQVKKVDSGSLSQKPPSSTNLTLPTVCGEDIISDNGNIHSPNYPEKYSSNENCLWKIVVSENHQVALNFHKIKLEYGAECEYDYIEILDEDRSRKLCGSPELQTVISSGNELSVKFISDAVNENIGFFAEFTKVEMCGGNIVAEQGAIQSRNFPENYLPNEVCIWKITIPDSYKVLLKFKAFETEEKSDCGSDYVEVIDGHDSNSLVLGRFCGSDIPSDIISSGHKIKVIFSSDYGKEYYGFSAEFSKIAVSVTTVDPLSITPNDSDTSCGGYIVSEKGYLLSPNYPNNYNANEECTWFITVPEYYQVHLHFKFFNVEVESSCKYDYLEVRDGHDDSSQRLGKFCGSRYPDDLVSSGNQMVVKFKTDSSGQNRGFAAEFKRSGTVDEETENTKDQHCVEHIVSDEGSLRSPNYPENYGPNERCSWKITVPAGNRISLKFTSFKVEVHDQCKYDYVEIRDGHTKNSRILARLCGYDIPKEILSSSNKILVNFNSDSSSEYNGFSAEFERVFSGGLPSNISETETGSCGGTLTERKGIIRNPNYPEPYPEEQDCLWKIIAPEGHRVILSILSVNLEYGASCEFDYLEVRDGLMSNSSILEKLCGVEDSEIIRSSGNAMTIQFVSDDSIETSGFSANYRTVSENQCGGNIVADGGLIQSPNYPNAYESGELCTWNITVPENYTIAFKFQSLNVTCEDAVIVRDGISGDSLGSFCGSDLPDTVFSVGNEIQVIFESDASVEWKGFSAEFRKVKSCGGDIYAEEGVIQSPNDPDNDVGLTCKWTITVPDDYRVRLSLTNFDVDCKEGYVIITEHHGNKVGRYCGPNAPPNEIISGTKSIDVQYVSNGTTIGKGFSAEFSKDVCRRNIAADSGTISSDNYPNNYFPESRCIWKITVPENHVVVLQFDSFELENCENCNCDSLEIRDGDQLDSPVLGKFCGTQIPQEIRSSSENMIVKFRTDNSVQHDGFTANFHKEISPENEVTNFLRQFPSIIMEGKNTNTVKEPNQITRLIRSILRK